MSSAFGSTKRSVLDFGWLANLRSDRHQFRVRMVQQQPDEFLAGVSRSADDGDFFRFHDLNFPNRLW